MTSISVADLLPARRIIPRLRARDRRDALRALARRLVREVPAAKSAIMGAVSACAAYPAFGPGTGVALLHSFVSGLQQPLAAAARLDPAISFGAFDGSRTDIVVLLLSPPGRANLHLCALACLARCLRREDVRRHLRGTEDPDSMYVVMARDEIAAAEGRPEVGRERRPEWTPANPDCFEAGKPALGAETRLRQTGADDHPVDPAASGAAVPR